MIEAVNLTKRFDDIVAVDHISATIRDGSVFGLIHIPQAGQRRAEAGRGMYHHRRT